MERKSKMIKLVDEDHGNTKYTDEMLIEWIKQFDRRSDLRKDSFYKYTTCLRRGLQTYFPGKRTRTGLEVGTMRLELLKKKDEENKVKKKKVKKVVEKTKFGSKTHTPGSLYPPFYKEGVKTCVRCKSEKTYSGLSICRVCNNEVGRLIRANLDHTPGNVKDEFCRIRIRFDDGSNMEIEYSVDEKQIQKLIREGYWFILKNKNKI